eukprot:4214063-Pyramimonas_sp.AAC.1
MNPASVFQLWNLAPSARVIWGPGVAADDQSFCLAGVYFFLPVRHRRHQQGFRGGHLRSMARNC